MSLTVGALRLVLDGLPDDLGVAVPGSEFDYELAGSAHLVKDLDWVEDTDLLYTDDPPEPTKRDMLVIDL